MQVDPELNAFTVTKLMESIGLTGAKMPEHWRLLASKYRWPPYTEEGMFELRMKARRQGMDMELWDRTTSLMDPSGQAAFTKLGLIVKTVDKMHTLNWSSVDPISVLPVVVYYAKRYDFRWNTSKDWPVPEYIIDRKKQNQVWRYDGKTDFVKWNKNRTPKLVPGGLIIPTMLFGGSEDGKQCWKFVSFFCDVDVTRPAGEGCWFWCFSHWMLKGRLGDVWQSFGLPEVINKWSLGTHRPPSLPSIEKHFDNSADAFNECITFFHEKYPHAVEQMSVRLCKTRLPANSSYRHLKIHEERLGDLVEYVPQLRQLPWATSTIPVVELTRTASLAILTKAESCGWSDGGMIVFDRLWMFGNCDLYSTFLSIMVAQDKIYDHGLDLHRFVLVQGLAIPKTGSRFALPLYGCGQNMHAQIMNQSLAQLKVLSNAWMSIAHLLEFWSTCRDKYRVWISFDLVDDVYIDAKNSGHFKIFPQAIATEEPRRVAPKAGSSESHEVFYLEHELAYMGLTTMLLYCGQYLASMTNDAT